MGVFARIMEGLAAASPEPKTIMIDATYLKAHRTATSLQPKKGARSIDRANPGWHEHQSAYRHRCRRAADPRARGLGSLNQSLILELMTAGQVSDYLGAAALLRSLPGAD